MTLDRVMQAEGMLLARNDPSPVFWNSTVTPFSCSLQVSAAGWGRPAKGCTR